MRPTPNSPPGPVETGAPVASTPVLISVVIPTRNRLELLDRTLQSLDAQIGLAGSFEVIVADDGSSDATPDYLASVVKSFRFRLRSLRLSGGGPATARNRAIALASSKRVLLLGDDTFPATDLLAQHMAGALADDVGIQGRIEWDLDAPVTPVMRFLAPEGPQFYFKGLVHGQPIPYTLQYASNFSAPTRWFREDPFDETFPNAAFEDTELAFRWRRRGHRVIYSDRALCRHRHHYASIEGFLEKQLFAGRAARRAIRLHPVMAARTVFQPLAVGLLRGGKYAWRRFQGKARDEDKWDLLCRAAFFRGLLSRRVVAH